MVLENKKLVELIETYKDFPKKGIEFKDILGIIQEPKIFKELILLMMEKFGMVFLVMEIS